MLRQDRNLSEIAPGDTPVADSFSIANGWMTINLDSSASISVGYEMAEKSSLPTVCTFSVLLAAAFGICAYLLISVIRRGN